MAGDKAFTFTKIACEELPKGLACLRFSGTPCGKLAVTFTLSGIEIALDKG